jgi:hypothetical protein
VGFRVFRPDANGEQSLAIKEEGVVNVVLRLMLAA